MPSVRSPTSLDTSFLGDTVQIGVVSRDLDRTAWGMVRAGIGPWQVFTFSPANVRDMTYRGAATAMTFRLAMAWSGAMMWEIIQPLEGPSIYADFLEQHGEGVHHVLTDCDGLAWDDRLRRFDEHGYAMVQSGVWEGRAPYAYFATEGDIGTTIETSILPEDFTFPEPEAWYPAPPPNARLTRRPDRSAR